MTAQVKHCLVAFSLSWSARCLFLSAVVMLKPVQEVNKALDRKRNILAAAGMLVEGKSVEEQFARVSDAHRRPAHGQVCR